MIQISKNEYERLIREGRQKQLRRTKKHYYKILDNYVESNNGKPRPRFRDDE